MAATDCPRGRGPDDARRRKLLNILLAGLAMLSILALTGTLIVDLSVAEQFGEVYATALAVLVGVIVIWAINRYGSGWLASVVFLLMLTVVLVVADLEVAGEVVGIRIIAVTRGTATVPISISLIFVIVIRTIVAGIAIIIAVRVLLARIEYLRAIVLIVMYPIIVSV